MTEKKYAVINEETQLSAKWTFTKQEAQQEAQWMTIYHKEKYIVVKLEKQNGVLI